MKTQENNILRNESEAKVKDYIFIIEDDKFYRNLLEVHLSKIKNYNVLTFSTGEDCFRQLRSLKPKIILIDYRLNDEKPLAMNGISLLKKLKIFDPNLFIIMVSSTNDIKLAVECLRNGAEDYVLKNSATPIKISNRINRIYDILRFRENKKIINKKIRIYLILITVGILSISFSSLVLPQITPLLVPFVFLILVAYAYVNREIIYGKPIK